MGRKLEMKIPFQKMHGCGNDFIVVDARKLPKSDWKKNARALLDRRFGVGGDSLLVIEPNSTKDAVAKMRVFEKDDRESEMCGNGIRCMARWALPMRSRRVNC